MKRTKFVRSLSMALALILLCAALPFGALAAESETYKKPHVEITAEHVTLDQTHFEYTGEEIRPNITVRVDDKLLTLDKEYTLEYKNNVEVGTATVIVKGRTNAKPVGYSGKVAIPFYIDPKTSDEDQKDLITIIGTDVIIAGTEFIATGEAIEPGITVTVAGKELVEGEDYTLVYENNLEPGTASVTVTGVADKGYTGSVTIHFTIQAAPETPTEPEETQPEETQPEDTKPEETQPEETQPEETQPEETQPEETQPEETQPEETQPEDTKPVSYKILKGNGAVWHKDSGKSLSFTVDGDAEDFVKVEIDGKTVNSKYYTVKDGKHSVITLKDTFLQHLENGKYDITIQFTDGEAEGRFKITAPADDSNPKTGDSFALHSWTALLFVSLTGIIGTAFAFRKKIWK